MKETDEMDNRKKVWYILCVVVILISLISFVINLATGACTGSIETAAGDQVPMKCYWTVKMVTYAMLIPALMSVTAIILRDHKASVACAVAVILISLFMLFTMSDLGIGICPTAGMHCRMAAGVMKAASVLQIIIAAVQAVECRNSGADADDADERPKRRF